MYIYTHARTHARQSCLGARLAAQQGHGPLQAAAVRGLHHGACCGLRVHGHHLPRHQPHSQREALPTQSPPTNPLQQVERKIERNGSSTYGLLKGNPHRDNPTFTVVTRSKEELVSMLDAFNIQVRPVVCVLSPVHKRRLPSHHHTTPHHTTPHHTVAANRLTTPARCLTRRTPSASSRATPRRSTASSRRSVCACPFHFALG